jgi:hypothetical protein
LSVMNMFGLRGDSHGLDVEAGTDFNRALINVLWQPRLQFVVHGHQHSTDLVGQFRVN